MRRRALLVGASAAAACALLGSGALAGSYLDRAALLLEEGRKEAEAIKSRTGDKELLTMVKAMTDARVKAARKMIVPSQVTSAHPHLLLVLESYDRAVDALIAGNTKKFAESLVTAADEERTFRNLIKELGYSLPKL